MLINGDRHAEYGDASKNFGTVAALWSIRLGIPVSAVDVGVCMTLFKIARLGNDPKLDTFVDAIGYLALTGEIELGDNRT